MRKSRTYNSHTIEPHNFWPSFADVMSAFVLVLFFLMILTFIQNIMTGDNLRVVEDELSQASTDLINAKYNIKLAQDELLQLQKDIDEANITISEKEDALVLSQSLIDEQNLTIQTTNESLDLIRRQMQGIALLRMDVLSEVQSALQTSLDKSETTKSTTVEIGENANIIIGGSFLFEYNSATITKVAKPVLDQLAIAFYDVLKSEGIDEKIDTIIISGHTDNTGSAAYNWELSTNRAQAVVNYLFKSNPKLEIEYGEYFSAAGYGENRPIVDNDTKENQAMNRRIEIAIVVKDSLISDMINDYLEQTKVNVG